MATKTELFVIAVISENNTQYVGLDATNNTLVRVDNPIEIKRCFTHDDAHKVKLLMKTSKTFLQEGESVRVKAITQCLRDYCGKLLRTSFIDTVIAGDETIKEVAAGLVVEEPSKEEVEAVIEPVAEEKVETVEEPKEEVKAEKPKRKKKEDKAETK